MDHKMRLMNLVNWVAMTDPNPAAVATETAKVAGLIAHHTAEDECELEHADDVLTDRLKAALKTGKDV